MRVAQRLTSAKVVSGGLIRLTGQMVLFAWLALGMASAAFAQATCTWTMNGIGSWDDPANWSGCSGGDGSPAGTPGPSDEAIIGAGTPFAEVTLDAPDRTVSGFSLQAGLLTGNASLTVSTQLNWGGGELSATSASGAVLTLNAGATGTIDGGPHPLTERILRNLGTIVWSSGDIALSSGAILENQGVFNINAGGVFSLQKGAPALPLSIFGDFTGGQLLNTSTPGARIETIGTGLAEIRAGLSFDNQNDVILTSGALLVGTSGPDAGHYQVAAGTRLDFALPSGDSRTLNGTTSISGAGLLRNVGLGTVDVGGDFTFAGETQALDGTLIFNTSTGTVAFPQLQVRAPAVLDGDVDFVVSGTLQWDGGDIRGAGGSLTLQSVATATLTLTDQSPIATLASRNLINQGSMLVTATNGGGGDLFLDSSDVDNQGTFEFRNNGAASVGLRCVSIDCGTFVNQAAGTLTLNNMGGGITIASDLTALNNLGLVDVTGTCASIDAPGTDTGTFRYSDPCGLSFATRSGSERVFESSVILDEQGSSQLVLDGKIRINGAARSFQTLVIAPNGTLYGPAAITFDGSTRWFGVIEGTGISETVTVGSSGTLETGDGPFGLASDTPTLRSRLLTNDGVLAVQYRLLLLDASPQIVNNASMTLAASPMFPAGISCTSPPVCGTVVNTGAISTFSNGQGLGPSVIFDVDVVLDQQGLLDASSGVLDLEANFTAQPGSGLQVQTNAVINRSSGPLILAAGTLLGDGVVRADVQAQAVDIAPGFGPGGLTINGSFSATASTTYSMEIGGIAPPQRVNSAHQKLPSAQYDRLTISGSATLDGTVNILDIGYTPGVSDVFTLFSYANSTGSLALGANPHAGFALAIGATRTQYSTGVFAVCEWIPGGATTDWTDPLNWGNCSTGVGPGPGPVGTPGASDRALIATGSVNLDVPITVDALELTGGATAGGSPITVTGELIWTGGTLGEFGGGEILLDSGAVGLFAGGQKVLDGRTLRIAGSATWTTGLIELANGAVLAIDPGAGLITRPSAAPEQIFASGSGTPQVSNFGTIQKDGIYTSGIGGAVEYVGSGDVIVDNGEFIIAAGSPSPFDGNFISNLGTLRFTGSSRSFGGSATLGGAGLLAFGDTLGPTSFNQVDACLSSPANIRVENAELSFNCASPTALDYLNLADPGAVVDGSSAISIVGSLEWNYGLIRGTAPGETFEIAVGATGSLSRLNFSLSGRFLSNRQFSNHGLLVWVGENPLSLESGAQLRNESDGQMRILLPPGADTTLQWDASVGAALLNLGNIDVDEANLFRIDPPFDQSGTVNINTGTMQVSEGGADTGAYAIGLGSTLAFEGSNAVRNLGSGSSVSGLGTLLVKNSASVIVDNVPFAPDTVDVQFSGSLQIDSVSPVSINNWVLTSAILTGNAPLEAANSFTWVSGQLRSTSLTPLPFVVAPGANLQIIEQTFFPRPDANAPAGALIHTLSQRELQIQGNADWNGGDILVPTSDTGRIVVSSGANLNLTAGGGMPPIFGCLGPPCTAELDVVGTLRHQGSFTDISGAGPLTVSGNLLIESGTLNASDVVQSAGVVDVSPGATLDATTLTMNGGVLQGSGTINASVNNVAGSVQPGGISSGGYLSIIGTYQQGAAGSLDIELSGLNPGFDADYLFVAGIATLDGTVNVTDAGFTPTPPQSYAFLNTDIAFSGAFANSNIAFPGYEITYTANDAVLSPQAVPLQVNSVVDPGNGTCDVSECTLREAIDLANSTPGADIIEFAIPGGSCVGAGGACVIVPNTQLPQITDSLFINGYTQTGSVPNVNPPGVGLGSNAALKIEIDGNLASAGSGLVINAPSSIVSVAGLAIHSFQANVVTQGPGDSNYDVLGNFIGLRVDGSAPALTPGVGIAIQGGNTSVGDSTAAGMNVISGNQQQGIVISNIPILANAVVRGNLIGTNLSGTLAVPNGLQGILATTSTNIPGIVIGGDLPDDRNVISGNAQDGIRFDCSASVDACFDGARVVGNLIGPAADGAPLGNIGHGVNLASMDGGRVFVGGPNPGEGNLIAFNGGNGITATFGGIGRGTFQRNEIFANFGQAIDLGADGRTANDANDPDTGANGLLNFPYFTGYVLAGTGDSADIDVLLDTPDVGGNYPADVDLYLALEDEPGVYLGSMTCAQPNVTCSATISFPAGVLLTTDDVILGVVVDSFGKTSEASFYTSATAITGNTPDPTDVGVPYDVNVEVSSPDPFIALGAVDVDDGVGNMCVAALSNSGGGVATGTCQLPTTGPAASVLTLTANYVAGPAPFTDSSGSGSHMVNAAPQPPVITLISPARGSVTGGGSITVTGSNFIVGATAFDFGGSPGGSVSCSSPTQCTATVPAGTGTVNIRATTVVGTSVDTRADDFTYQAGPPLLCTNVAPGAAVPTGGNPYTLAAGDFDGDGNRDLAVVNSDASGTVAVLLGNGAGSFAAAASYPVNPFPRSVAVGDFNDDGLSDLAVANYGANNLSILLGTGAGAFGAASAVPLGGGSGPHAVGVGDFNGDGFADLAVALLDASSLAILIGDGTGNFDPPTVYPALRSATVAVGDFNGDGRSDVAIGNLTTNAASVVFGDGTGALSGATDYPLSGVPSQIAVGDFDGNGIMDLALTVAGSNTAEVLLGGPAGMFSNPVALPVGTQPRGLDVGDFDGDGITDLAISNSNSNDISLLLGNGFGSFAPAISFGGLNFPAGVVFGDFDGDDYADLAVLNNFSEVVPLLNVGCPPTVDLISPSGGPEAGGTLVNITGSGFVVGATSFAFGATPALSASCTSTTDCTATSPPGSGTVSVSATTVAGISADTSADDFAYLAETVTLITSISPEPSVVGEPYTVVASVTQGGTPLASGSVEIRQLSDGSSCSYSLKSGLGCQLVANSALTTAVRAYYLGSGGSAPSVSPIAVHVVNRAATEIVISSDTPDPSAVGQQITVLVELAVTAPGAGTPTGDVLITDGSASCGFSLPQTSCSFVPKSFGLTTLEARYLGDANFAPSVDTEEHTVSADGADLSIIKRNGLRVLPAGQASTYVIAVNNAGPQDVFGARVTDLLPPQLINASWTCTSTGGAVCPLSGIGTVDALVDMPAGSTVTFLLTVTAQADPEQVVTNTATVAPPGTAPDPVPANNQSTDVDPIGVFGEGFEEENE